MTPRRVGAVDVVWLAGGVALLASAFLHWVRRGPGNSLRGHELVDTLTAVGNDVPGLSGARMTLLWYLVPTAGAVSWIVFGLAGLAGRAAAVTAGLAALVTIATVAGFARLAGAGDLGLGPLVALLGAGALVGAVFGERRSRKH